MTQALVRSETVGPLTVAGEPIDYEQAVEIIAGYCFGYAPLKTKAPLGGVGLALPPRNVGVFAYRTYDCVAPAPGDTLEPIDVLVANGLNARMQGAAIGAVLAAADEISAELKEIPANKTFWDLPRDAIVAAPDEGPGSHLWRAWTILMSLPGVKIATTHKILHHKRPNFFPLIDRETLTPLGTKPWLKIYDDLSDNPDGWQNLETRIAERADNRAVRLTRLRLHDILLWTKVTRRDERARKLGQDLPLADH